MLRVASVVMAIALSGCFAFAAGSTREQELSRHVDDTRVTEQEADVDGRLCYVDHKTTVSFKRRIPKAYRIAVGTELLVGGLVSLGGNPYFLYMTPLLLDGLITLIYIAGQDNHDFQRTRWEPSNDTGTCTR
jgi:hypothetical protein